MATYTDAIQKLYVAYFSRPADPAGLAYWEGVVTAAKGDTSAVSAAFAASTEYQTAYAQVNVSGVLSQIYLNLFGHPADAPGLAYWIKAIGDKEFTIDQAVTKIAAGAQGSDKVAFEQKVLVATSFTAAVDTDAEKAGYKGTDANKAAKDFLATIKTAADAEAALKVLDTKVADVIKAGVPFTVAGALKALADAQAAEAAFLVTADGDNNAATNTSGTALTAVKAAADIAVGAAIGGAQGTSYNAVGQTDTVKLALLGDAIDANTKALKAPTDALAAANKAIADVKPLAAAVSAVKAADAAAIAAQKAFAVADTAAKTAESSYNNNQIGATKPATIVLSANGTVKAGSVDLISLVDGKLVLATGVTEATTPGITAVLNAAVARAAADVVGASATKAAETAHTILDRTDVDLTASGVGTTKEALVAVGKAMTIVKGIPDGGIPTGAQIETELQGLKAIVAAATPATKADADAKLAAFSDLVDKFDTLDNAAAKPNPLTSKQAGAAADLKLVTDKIDALTTATKALDAAKANVDSYDGLHKAVTDAENAFTLNKLAVPVVLSTFNAGTSADDIFVAGKVSSTVTDLSKTDKLFIGADYVLNTGDLKAGNNAALEIFLKQVGANTEVTVETKAYGSDSQDTITITLVGVSAADVHFDGGIVTV